jgi:hypothetical protein
MQIPFLIAHEILNQVNFIFPISLHHGRKTLLVELLPKFNSFITLEKTLMHGGHLLSVYCHHSGLGFAAQEIKVRKLILHELMAFFPFQFNHSTFTLNLDFFTACVITCNNMSLETTGK